MTVKVILNALTYVLILLSPFEEEVLPHYDGAEILLGDLPFHPMH